VVDLAALFERTARLIAPAADTKGIAFSATCKTGLRLWVDPDQAQQILLNLCLNAVEASAPGQGVAIDGQAWGERVCVTVVDQGCGIPEAALQQVRQPFSEHLPTTAGSQRIANGAREQPGRGHCGDPGFPHARSDLSEVSDRCLKYMY
jgi:two-component system sensor histidine kinase HydH